jgi:hypothetical protein
MKSPLRFLGIGTVVGGGVAVLLGLFLAALLIGPLIFWIAWNVLDFAAAVGLPELGFWAIALASLFLTVGWFGKSLITGTVFIVDPAWLEGSAQAHWPDPGLANFIAIVLLAILAGRPHAHAHKTKKNADDKKSSGPMNVIAHEIAKEVRSAAAK